MEKMKNQNQSLTRKQQTLIGNLYVNIPDELNELDKAKKHQEVLEKRLSDVKEKLQGTPNKEVPWLDEDNSNVKKLKDKAKQFQEQQNKKFQTVINEWEVSGTIKINDEQSACNSCSGIIQQFVNKFGEKVKITITPAVEFYYGKRGHR